MLFLLAAVPAVHAQKPKKESLSWLEVNPEQKVVVKGESAVARQLCLSWVWAAGVESLLRRQGAGELDQRFWVTKQYGGEVCRSEWIGFDQLAKTIGGDYALASGRKVRLTARYQLGAPTQLDDFIVAVRDGNPPLLYWKQQPYLVVGLVYDEYIARTGNRWFEIRQIRLLDPRYEDKDDRRLVTFVKGRDNPAEIDGLLSVAVSSR